MSCAYNTWPMYTTDLIGMTADIGIQTNSNGGRDVFVDIGDKSWGVTVCQKYFEKQSQSSGTSKLHFGPENTLHVGDQFLSAGANDFRARSVGTTAWIASPEETVYVFFFTGKIRIPSLSVFKMSHSKTRYCVLLWTTACLAALLPTRKLTMHHSDLLDELGDLMYKKLT